MLCHADVEPELHAVRAVVDAVAHLLRFLRARHDGKSQSEAPLGAGVRLVGAVEAVPDVEQVVVCDRRAGVEHADAVEVVHLLTGDDDLLFACAMRDRVGKVVGNHALEQRFAEQSRIGILNEQNELSFPAYPKYH